MTTKINYGETYGISFGRMVDRISYVMEDTFDIKPTHARTLLMEFMMHKGEEAVVAMYGFIRWIQTHKEEDKRSAAYAEAIGHDISERADLLSLPRTSSYIEFAHL